MKNILDPRKRYLGFTPNQWIIFLSGAVVGMLIIIGRLYIRVRFNI